MPTYILKYGDAHEETVITEPDRDQVVCRRGIWVYVATKEFDEQGRQIARAMSD